MQRLVDIALFSSKGFNYKLGTYYKQLFLAKGKNDYKICYPFAKLIDEIEFWKYTCHIGTLI